METTKVFSDVLAAYIDPAVRIIACRGGTRSSKTWSILQLLNTIAAKSRKPRLISVVSETLPHLRRGAIRDFKNMLETDGVYSPSAWHDTDKLYSYNKGKIEFFSAADSGRVHGPARDVLYVNECINMTYEVCRHLFVRTTEKIILDYNPAFEFWIDSKVLIRPDVRLIDSTYLDNDMLSAAQIAEIESNREIDPDWWAVYGEGRVGSIAGLVIKKWDIIPDMPEGPYKKDYIGIDFGWSKPSAIMRVALGERDEVFIDQIGYARNMDNPDIAQAIHDAGLSHLECICDAAEPKSIKELRAAGIKAVKTENKDIKLGLRIMNRYKKHYTARSLDSIDENRKYRYKKDEHDNYTDDPIDEHNHAKDAERYIFLNKLSNIASGYDVTVGSAARKH